MIAASYGSASKRWSNAIGRSVTHEAPLQMILGVFSSPTRAKAVRRKLRESERLEVISIVSLALIKRDEGGRLELLEARRASDWSERRSESLSGILRLLWGPTQDASSSARLHGLAEALPPGSSAIAALIEHRWVNDVRALMEEAGADTVSEALKSEIAAALAERRDLVVTAGAADWRADPLRRLGVTTRQGRTA
jgi:hypothetical protein